MSRPSRHQQPRDYDDRDRRSDYSRSRYEYNDRDDDRHSHSRSRGSHHSSRRDSVGSHRSQHSHGSQQSQRSHHSPHSSHHSSRHSSHHSSRHSDVRPDPRQRRVVPYDGDRKYDDDNRQIAPYRQDPLEIVTQRANIPLVAKQPIRRPIRRPLGEDYDTFIPLIVNAVRARPIIRGIRYQYSVQFFNNEQKDAREEDIDQSSRHERREIFIGKIRDKVIEHFGRDFDFDNTVMYASKKVDEKRIPWNEEKDRYVRIKFRKELKFQSQEDVQQEFTPELIMQVAHIIHRGNMTSRRMGFSSKFGRNFFVDVDFRRAENLRLTEYPNLNLLRGFQMGFQHTQDFGCILYVRNRTRLLDRRSIAEVMYELRERSPTREDWRDACRQELEGRFFITSHTGQVQYITRIDWTKTILDTFDCRGRETSYKDYFDGKYNTRLREDELPLLQHVSRRDGRSTHYPPELCCVTGYPKSARHDDRLRKEVAKRSAVNASLRPDMAEGLFRRLQENNEHRRTVWERTNRDRNQPLGRELNYDTRLLQLEGRILPDANILVMDDNNQSCLIPGSRLMGSIPKTRPLPMQDIRPRHDRAPMFWKWGILAFIPRGDDRNRAQDDYDHLRKEFRENIGKWFYERGRPIDCPVVVEEDPYDLIVTCEDRAERDREYWNDTKRRAVRKLEEAVNRGGLSGVVIIMPAFLRLGSSRCNELYGLLKYHGNCQLALVTQMIHQSNVQKYHALQGTFRQFMVKLGFIPWKVIFKCGEIPQRLAIEYPNENDEGAHRRQPQQYDRKWTNYLPDGRIDLNVPTMIVGVDVCHDMRRYCSVIGFVSTYDADFTRVQTQCAIQDRGQEVVGIQQFHVLLLNALDHFERLNRVLPQQIFLYRDGVSESQLNSVVQQEIEACHTVFQCISERINNEYLPKLEVIIVQKRVNARFFVRDPRSGIVSAPPRTVVDEGIVAADKWDFYLIASAAPRDKCAGPVRCIVIHDGLNLADPRNSGVNDLEMFTYGLCCLYFNWPGGVKVPHVVKHADKVAALVSQQLAGKPAGVEDKDNIPNAFIQASYFHL